MRYKQRPCSGRMPSERRPHISISLFNCSEFLIGHTFSRK
jgi:hypothetical protein